MTIFFKAFSSGHVFPIATASPNRRDFHFMRIFPYLLSISHHRLRTTGHSYHFHGPGGGLHHGRPHPCGLRAGPAQQPKPATATNHSSNDAKKAAKSLLKIIEILYLEMPFTASNGIFVAASFPGHLG